MRLTLRRDALIRFLACRRSFYARVRQQRPRVRYIRSPPLEAHTQSHTIPCTQGVGSLFGPWLRLAPVFSAAYILLCAALGRLDFVGFFAAAAPLALWVLMSLARVIFRCLVWTFKVRFLPVAFCICAIVMCTRACMAVSIACILLCSPASLTMQAGLHIRTWQSLRVWLSVTHTAPPALATVLPHQVLRAVVGWLLVKERVIYIIRQDNYLGRNQMPRFRVSFIPPPLGVPCLAVKVTGPVTPAFVLRATKSVGFDRVPLAAAVVEVSKHLRFSNVVSSSSRIARPHLEFSFLSN